MLLTRNSRLKSTCDLQGKLELESMTVVLSTVTTVRFPGQPLHSIQGTVKEVLTHIHSGEWIQSSGPFSKFLSHCSHWMRLSNLTRGSGNLHLIVVNTVTLALGTPSSRTICHFWWLQWFLWEIWRTELSITSSDIFPMRPTVHLQPLQQSLRLCGKRLP